MRITTSLRVLVGLTHQWHTLVSENLGELWVGKFCVAILWIIGARVTLDLGTKEQQNSPEAGLRKGEEVNERVDEEHQLCLVHVRAVHRAWGCATCLLEYLGCAAIVQDALAQMFCCHSVVRWIAVLVTDLSESTRSVNLSLHLICVTDVDTREHDCQNDEDQEESRRTLGSTSHTNRHIGDLDHNPINAPLNRPPILGLIDGDAFGDDENQSAQDDVTNHLIPQLVHIPSRPCERVPSVEREKTLREAGGEAASSVLFRH